MKLWGSSKASAVETGDGLPTRAELRERNREIQKEVAEQAAERRATEGKDNVVERVEKATRKLNGQNATQAIQTIELTSPTERDHYLLAEKYGQARKGVLRAFGPPRRSVENAYIQAVGLETPDETPADESPTAGQPEE